VRAAASVIHSDPEILSGTPVFYGTQSRCGSCSSSSAQATVSTSSSMRIPRSAESRRSLRSSWRRTFWPPVRILPDESLPRQLAGLLTGHDVTTVPRAGWAGLRNGELLLRADGEYEVFITGDRGLMYQQNLGHLRLRIVLIVAPDNRVETITALAPLVLQAIQRAQPGQVEQVAG